MIKRFIGKLLAAVLFLVAFNTAVFAYSLQEWAATYNGPANGNDSGSKVVVDAQANVYVTGTSEGITGKDFMTIKYSSRGEKQWEARYDGPDGYDDDANAIAVDRNGNVYVTGASQGADGCWSYVVIKYRPEGTEEWIKREGLGCSNQPIAISTDETGNIYVTVNLGSDIATIKYDSNGIQLWKVIYDAPYEDVSAAAMVTDANGNVYIVGSIGSYWSNYKNYLTIKYDTDGKLQWVGRYGGPVRRDDRASAIAVDKDGNVYVTGYTWYYYRAGSDYGTVKYSSDGVQQWVAIYNGPPYYGLDVATSIAVDANGYVYVTGISEGNGTWMDYATVKYDTTGIEQWVRRYNGPGNNYDIARQVAVDARGNVYVTGSSSGVGSGLDYATVMYNSFGDEQWVMRYNGLGNGDDNASSIAIDYNGNVYVTGGSYGGATGIDYATIKYSREIVVNIDIKPGSFPNSINPDARGVIPVAILSSDSFDATNVDPSSVRFGHSGATVVHKADIEDVNNDGYPDLILHFDTEATGVKEGDTRMSLIGWTYKGQFIQGSDSIVTAGKSR